MLADEARAADAKASEIAAIWRAQQRVQEEWAAAVVRAEELDQELLDVW